MQEPHSDTETQKDWMAQKPMDEVREVPEQNVPIDPTHIDPETLVLNHGDSFGVFDRWGDILNVGKRLQGVFHAGSRYLSYLEVRVFDQRPLLLSSTIREDNDVLSADYSNPYVQTDDQIIEEGTIHINRIKFIRNGVFFERFQFHSFQSRDVEIPVRFFFDADFQDIFQARGFVRKSPMGPTRFRWIDDKAFEIVYDGLDEVPRRTLITCSRAFEYHHSGEISLHLNLGAHETRDLEIAIYLQEGGKGDRPDLQSAVSLAALENEIDARKKSFARIKTSHDQFNHWMSRSQSDLVALLAKQTEFHYPYAGVPWYNTAFGRDGLLTAFQTLVTAPQIARDVLLHLAENQADRFDDAMDAEPGKILHEVRSGELVNLGEIPFKKYYGSVDSTPLFVWLAGLYYERSADWNTIERIWPNLERALEWIEKHSLANKDGFARYFCRTPGGLRNQGWKDSEDSVFHESGALAEGPIALCEVQGYIYQAKTQMALLAEERGDFKLSRRLYEEADAFRKRFNETFWDRDLGFFVMALDGEDRPCRVISSNPGHCLATEIVDPERAAIISSRFLKDDLFSGWGVRTLSTLEKRYNPMSYHNGSIWPHDNSMLVFGLSQYGFKDEALRITQALFDSSLFLDLQRVPELYCGFPRRRGEGPTLYPVACSPQAWAVCAIFLMLRGLLGLKILAPQKEIILHTPRLPEFLKELRIENIWLGPRQRLSLRFIDYGKDVGVDILEKPADWELIIHK